MFFRQKNRGACPQYEARLEDHLESMRASGPLSVDPDLTAHLASCQGCRRAMGEAEAAGRLLREARQALPESLASDPFFANRVAARIRAYETSRIAPADFWPALETLSLRLSAAALSVALLLGAWAAWQQQAVPAAAPASARANTPGVDVRPVETRYLFPEMKRPPANGGEAMMVLASTENGRQR
jgi:predicted anti-sigma-YlaC factor YlaD